MAIKVVAFGDEVTCSKTRKFVPVRDGAEFRNWLSSSGTQFIYVDRSHTPNEYVEWRARVNGIAKIDYPSVCVIEPTSGIILGKFSASNYTTASKLIAKINSYCANCNNPVTPGGVCPTCNGKKRASCPNCGTTKTCWTCKGKGKI